jgi:hypothetical protein
MAHPDNLDAHGSCPRTRSFTDFLVQSFDVKTLWSRWGIVADVEVSCKICVILTCAHGLQHHSHLRIAFLDLTYMSSSLLTSSIKSLREDSKIIW